MTPLPRSTSRAFRFLLTAWLAAPLAAPLAAQAQATDLPLQQLKLPPGFSIELVARVPNARQMAWGDAPAGGGQLLYIGSRQEGKVHALLLDAQYKSTGAPKVIASGLNMPSGIAFHNGSLYVAALNRLLRYDNLGTQLDKPPAPKVLRDDLPTDRAHGWKYLGFGPDGQLYVPVGAPCNICKPDADRYAVILRMQPDGSKQEVYARGVRNTVGFDWHPVGKGLWFTDNGRDMLGDDLPPDELNHAPRAGLHFGYPYCHGGMLADPEFGREQPCSAFTAPAQPLGPHVAAIGMKFYTGTQFPPAYRNQAFIAEHGSWNRSSRIGYRVAMVTINGDKAVSYTPFITGWLQGEQAWGRPADLLVAPDGSLLIADDHANAVYRVRYSGS